MAAASRFFLRLTSLILPHTLFVWPALKTKEKSPWLKNDGRLSGMVKECLSARKIWHPSAHNRRERLL